MDFGNHDSAFAHNDAKAVIAEAVLSGLCVRQALCYLCHVLAPGPQLQLAELRLWGSGLTLSSCSWLLFVDCGGQALPYSVVVQLAWLVLAAGIVLLCLVQLALPGSMLARIGLASQSVGQILG